MLWESLEQLKRRLLMPCVEIFFKRWSLTHFSYECLYTNWLVLEVFLGKFSLLSFLMTISDILAGTLLSCFNLLYIFIPSSLWSSILASPVFPIRSFVPSIVLLLSYPRNGLFYFRCFCSYSGYMLTSSDSELAATDMKESTIFVFLGLGYLAWYDLFQF